MTLGGRIRKNRWTLLSIVALVWFALFGALCATEAKRLSIEQLGGMLALAIIPFVAIRIYHGRRRRDWIE